MSKSMTQMAPSIEGRLGAWQAIQERLNKQEYARIRPTVTISRNFGCEAFPLAEILAPRLEQLYSEPWLIYDKLLIESVAENEDISMHFLKNLGDASHRIEALGLMPTGYCSHSEAYNKVAKYLIKIAQIGNAIIVGRGGAILCRDMPNCFHFRLDASENYRIATLSRRMGISPEEAKPLVKENTRSRDKFLSKSLNANVKDHLCYHAVFNSERQSLDSIASAIIAIVEVNSR